MFLALAHMVGATQVMGWGGVGVGWGGDGNVHWTCTHGRCYTTACSLHLHTWSVLRKSWDGVGLGWCGVGMVMFIELGQKVSCTCLRDFLPEWFWSLCEFARACWRWIVCEYMTRCPDQTAAGVFDWHDRIWKSIEVWLLEASCLLVRCSNNLCGKCEKNAVMCWWKIKYFSPQKMKWYTFHPITFTFLKCRGGKSFHTLLLLYAV